MNRALFLCLAILTLMLVLPAAPSAHAHSCGHTGNEIIYLAQVYPGWRFTAVEPSAAMLDVCRLRAAEHGLASRWVFHHGYLDSLPATESFHAATAILVAQFILEHAARSEFFNAIARRLAPGGYLINADLAADTASSSYTHLLEVWLRMMTSAGVSAEAVEHMRAVYGRDVAVLPPAEVAAHIAAGGFEAPIEFFQGGLIHAWYARRIKDDV